jgi:hypothetical protein
VTERSLLGDANRTTGFARFHEAAEDFGDRAIGRIVIGRKTWHGRQPEQDDDQGSGSELGHFVPDLRQDSHFDSNCKA